MTQPKSASPRRPLQAPDDQSVDEPGENATALRDGSARTGNHTDTHHDTWVTHFMARLANLVRHTGGKN